jgi:NFU1 iron-sulfur cluster scaffold homolog, mitochondrial|tara:strand:- start:701 stop:973 length:273 start_codon:yes stop_codon:yes gene_type:complete
MTDRTEVEIIEQIHDLLKRLVAPAVASHGGEVNFISYANGVLKLQMSGACAGCAGAAATLKQGIEIMMKEYIPEITTIEGEDDVVINPYM